MIQTYLLESTIPVFGLAWRCLAETGCFLIGSAAPVGHEWTSYGMVQS